MRPRQTPIDHLLDPSKLLTLKLCRITLAPDPGRSHPLQRCSTAGRSLKVLHACKHGHAQGQWRQVREMCMVLMRPSLGL